MGPVLEKKEKVPKSLRAEVLLLGCLQQESISQTLTLFTCMHGVCIYVSVHSTNPVRCNLIPKTPP